MPLTPAAVAGWLLAGAASAPPPSPPPAASTTAAAHWTLQGQLGLQAHAGATDSLGLGLQGEAERVRGPHEVELSGAASVNESTQQSTRFGPGGVREQVRRTIRREEYRGEIQARRHDAERRHWVAVLGWHRNESQGLGHEARASLGYGWKLLHSEQTTLATETAVTYLWERHLDERRVRYPAAALALDLEHRLAPNGNLSARLEVIREISGGELVVLASSDLRVPFGKHLGVAVSARLTYDRRPPQPFFDTSQPEADALIEPERLFGNLQAGLSFQW